MCTIMELIGNNAAVIIALCALFYTAFQAHTTRKHNKLSVTPHITTFVYNHAKPGEGSLTSELTNNGLGPAVIKSFKIFLNGTELNIQSSEQAGKKLKEILEGKVFDHSTTILNNGYHVPAGEKRIIFAVRFPINEKQTVKDFQQKLENLSLTIEYESIYGQKFKYDSDKES